MRDAFVGSMNPPRVEGIRLPSEAVLKLGDLNFQMSAFLISDRDLVAPRQRAAQRRASALVPNISQVEVDDTLSRHRVVLLYGSVKLSEVRVDSRY